MSDTARLHTILLASVLLVGCGDTAGSRRMSSAVQDLELREGTITFHDPSPEIRSTVRRDRRPSPARIIVTTRTASGQRVDDANRVVAISGTARSPADIFRLARENQYTVVSPRRFRQLWRDLVAHGILELPRRDLTDQTSRPAERAYIEVDADGNHWLFLSPIERYRERTTEKEREQIQAWHLAKIDILSCSDTVNPR